ncbi:helicase-exonuclease AddAB subunit AddA [Aureibacillus halotolerans]|uniref:ATP-dependent helicase/nuclease subunit A n=1 Tax=Aureibacillus halotolerans TaxID=1508390 RepID=A0A4R6UAX6_9BACI|nr:helicase-exonuclease AddAB subunit AddA [Aureibacillus halotolerans]TDQ42069.1 DNA helicase/exodeoxyribonuclease V subunit A [Aureibacillus halotolerans]
MNTTPPEGTHWTEDQWKAIATEKSSLLVAAAAGSGKTAVLVERIIQKVTRRENPVDVDRLLVCTFTNAAAAEMRNRVSEALEKALAKEPGSLHLRRQLSLLNRASISTLHSYCMKLVKQYHYLTDIDPAFRIGDTAELDLIQDEVIEDVLEEEYGKENNLAFFEVMDRYTTDRSDTDVAVQIKRMYDFSRSHPWPSAWLNELVQTFERESVATIDESVYGNILLESVKTQAEGWKTMLSQALQLAKEPGGPAGYAPHLEDEVAQVEHVLSSLRDSWTTAAQACDEMAFKKLPAIRKTDLIDDELKQKTTELRDRVKKEWKLVQERYFARSADSYMKDFMTLTPMVRELVRLVNAFEESYEAQKKERGIVDFSDLEHAALHILRAPASTPDLVIPSEAAEAAKQYYEEIMVDEYQDTNLVQEAIVGLLANETNQFMVGDVKQSIYGFRLAEPALFTDKYRRFGDNDGGVKVDLSMNFRSRQDVLFAANHLFKQVMDEKVAKIAYDDAAALVPGLQGAYTPTEHFTPELLIVDQSGESVGEDEGSTEELDKAVVEARLMAQKIKEWVSQPEQYAIFDKHTGQTRGPQYRDIVILLRSMPWASAIMDTFRKEGIPVYAELASGYFQATEVAVTLSLLKVIDNPFQDIPLASVLRSPIVGLDEEQLALIRVANKRGSYFEALCAYEQVGEDFSLRTTCQLFLTRLNRWREKARRAPVAELIQQVYEVSGYLDYVGGLPGGKQRQANLQALLDRARQYEETSFRGLFRFMRFIERMQDRGDDLGAARALGEQEDVVRIMTIHKSKGLEFPFVLLAGLGRKFNTKDLSAKMLLHQHLGFGSPMINPVARFQYTTLPQLAIREQLQQEMIAEEMRVLYVAMTRAREKLCMVGTVANAEKKLNVYNMQAESAMGPLLSEFVRSNAASYLDWLIPAFLRHPAIELDVASSQRLTSQGSFHMEVVPLEKAAITSGEEAVKLSLDPVKHGEIRPVDDELYERVSARLRWRYPNEQLTKVKSKQTVTELKRKMDTVEAQLIDYRPAVKSARSSPMERPLFMQETKKTLTPAERGTVLHTVMQRLDWSEIHSEDDVEEGLERLVMMDQLTVEQRQSIEAADIYTFLNQPIGQQIRHADAVYKEVPFTFSVPSSKLYSVTGDAPVLIQGMIDLIFEDATGLYILDYKTDRISERYNSVDEGLEVLRKTYVSQLQMYAYAVEQIWKTPVKRAYLYVMDVHRVVEISPATSIEALFAGMGEEATT